MLRVFLTQQRLLCRYLPVYTEAIIKDAYASIGLWVIEFIAFILEYSRLAQHGKAMGKAFGDEELPVVLLCQLHGYMLTVCRRAFADIHRHIEHSAPNAAHQLALCEWRALKVQAAHHSV